MTIKVPDAKFSYRIYIGDKLPSLTIWPNDKEILYRLLFRAFLAKDLEEFKLEKSEQQPQSTHDAKE